MKTLKKDSLNIEVYDTRDGMGVAAAQAVAGYVRELHAKKETVNIVFAAAPSQNEFLAALSKADLPWQDVNAFHMDEYIGLDRDAPQRFGNFLKERIFGGIPFRSVHYLYDEGASPEEVCERYTATMRQYPADIVLMGIGENGHIAFNDPHVADFYDPLDVKVVTLDSRCREQQVHDGCFSSLDQVPTDAITLTIPVMLRAGKIFVIVPSAAKAKAIEATANGPITTQCPASILRLHSNATLYCDLESAKLII